MAVGADVVLCYLQNVENVCQKSHSSRLKSLTWFEIKDSVVVWFFLSKNVFICVFYFLSFWQVSVASSSCNNRKQGAERSVGGWVGLSSRREEAEWVPAHPLPPAPRSSFIPLSVNERCAART